MRSSCCCFVRLPHHHDDHLVPCPEMNWRSLDEKENRKILGAQLTTTQPSPEAAIELIHKQPVRWVHERQVSCDGGGGPLGHPRVYINVDKPQICTCGYCGLPFVRIPSCEAPPTPPINALLPPGIMPNPPRDRGRVEQKERRRGRRGNDGNNGIGC